MGRRKSGRDVSGVILLDKPLAVTSNAALQQVRRFFNANKAGHTGALDPLATGLLPLCFGEATKVSHFALEADKTYQVTAQLGVRTTTSDAEGEVVSQQPVTVDEATIRSLLPEFEGEQSQSPSMYSALKYEGRPLYYYARLGIDVPRKTRTIHIRSIQFLDFSNDQLKLEVTCSKGTYIRTLIDDLGQRLGCGAHVAALHRTWIEGVEGPWVT
ncbi:tRNA pseudouridine(55) synthase TruB, partial [Pseudidiomarina aestuarii]